MNKWISVKDELPKKEKIILIFNNEVRIGMFGDDSCGDGFYTTNFEQYLKADNVTHWMPLPEAPE
jgi:hypothetical protein